MMEVRELTRRYGERVVLERVTLGVAPGEVVALVGPSGGGKSTLLRCLNGLEPFDEGEVRVGEVRLGPGGEAANGKAVQAVRRRVGMVFQQWHLFEHRTALGNVMEGLVYVRGMKPREARAQARELLAQVGMTEREEAYPGELSGGEQQRVALARALALRPEVLLLDEPTSALDPERVGEVKELLRRLSGGGLALVVVTHEMGFVRGLASRVLVLHGGQVVEQGPPAEVLERPRHERTRAFLGLRGAAPSR